MWFLPTNKPGDVPEQNAPAQAKTPKPSADANLRPGGGPEADQKPLHLVLLENQPRKKTVREQMDDESRALYITLIFFAAISLRVLLFVLGPYGDNALAMYPDSYRYVELGETLVTQAQFARPTGETGVVHEPLEQLRTELGQIEPTVWDGLRPEIMRTPGYPVLIGAVAWMGLGVNGLLVLQCLFGAVSVLLVYKVGCVLLKRPGPALIAALIVALHPADIAAPTAVLSETLFTLMVLLGLWSIANKETRSVGSASFGGIMIGLSVLVRPVSVLLGPAFALWMIATDRRIKTVFLATLMTVLSLAPAAAWMARNQSIGFGYRLSSIPYINSYFYTDAYMRITEQGGDWRQDWPATVQTQFDELRAELNLNPDAEVFDTMKTLGVQAIKDNPWLYARVIKESVLKFFTDHSVGGLYQQLGLTYTPTGLRDQLMAEGLSWSALAKSLKNPTGWLALSWMGFNGLLLVGMVLGAVMLLLRGHYSALLLLGGVMFYFVFATQATGLERFRLPVLGVQALLAVSLFVPRLEREKKATSHKRRWYKREDAEDGDQENPTPIQSDDLAGEPDVPTEDLEPVNTTRPL